MYHLYDDSCFLFVFCWSVESVDSFSEVPNRLSPAFLPSSKQSREEASPEQIHGMAIQPSLKNCHGGHPLGSKKCVSQNAKLLLQKFCHSVTWKEQIGKSKGLCNLADKRSEHRGFGLFSAFWYKYH